MRGLLPFTLSLILAAGPAASGDDHPLGMPTYPQANDTRFTGVLEANDVPLDASVITTDDHIEKVMRFYRDEFKHRDINWVQNWLGPEQGYVGFYDPYSGTMRMVTTVALPNGGTMLIYSSMDPRPLLKKPAMVPEDLPALPEASKIVTTETTEGGERQRTVGYRIDGLPVDQVETRIIQSAAKLGWKHVKQELGADKNMLLFRRGQDRCIIAVRAKQDGEQSYSQVTMVVNDRPPDNATGAKP